MKKLLILLLMLCLFAASACAMTEGDFAYSIHDGKAKIAAYTGSADVLTLPETLGGYPVASIGVCAFRDCTSLTHLTLADGVVSIGSNAFQDCTSLSQIILPDSVVSIGTHAFYGCPALTEITLHDHFENIHIYAFYGCSAARNCRADSQTAVTLTNAGYSFTCPEYPQLALKAFEDESGMRTFTVADCDEAAVSVIFPDSVTAIARYAFYNCSALTEIVLPDSVAEIDRAAFKGCTSLRQITLPGGLAKLADDAFSGCRDVTILSPAGGAAQAFAEANASLGFSWQSP